MSISVLFENNRKWSKQIREDDPEFFSGLAHQQKPDYLWIGCSDSRVPANEIVGLRPGEVFVHRNVANLVMHTDFNCLSVVQFAVEVLKVRHIILTGHYGCGGVKAALVPHDMGLIDNWLHVVKLIADKHRDFLDSSPNETARIDRLCELNVIEQVRTLCENSLVRHAWLRRQPLTVHGWIYGLKDGILADLGVSVSGTAEIDAVCARAFQSLFAKYS